MASEALNCREKNVRCNAHSGTATLISAQMFQTWWQEWPAGTLYLFW